MMKTTPPQEPTKRRWRWSKPTTRRGWVLSIILAITIVYVLGGLLVSWQIYSRHNTKPINTAVKLYPLPAARVGLTFVPLSRYWRDLAAIRQYVKESNTQDKYGKLDLEHQVLDRLVRAATVRRLAHRYNISVSQKEVDDAYSAAAQNEGSLMERNLKKYYNFVPADFKVWIAESLLEKKVNDTLPLRRNVSHILFAVDANASDQAVADAKTKADAVKALIAGGLDFGEAAKENSNDATSRDNGGSLGWINQGTKEAPIIDPAFDEAAFSAPLNQVIGPVRSGRGWHLILVKEQTGQVSGNLEQIISQEEKDAGTARYLP